MEPTKLDLHNFLSYRDQEVDLSLVQLAALVGENGAGKSSLLDALLWALYGESTKGGPRALDNHIRRGETDCRVELQFRLGGQFYRVVRARSAARNKSILEFFVLEGEDVAREQVVVLPGDLFWRPLSGKTVGETQAIIEATLRMDYRTFVSSALVLQGQSDAFTANMTDSERKEALGRILGLDLWDRLQAAAKEHLAGVQMDARAGAEVLRRLDDQVAGKGARQAAVDEADRQAATAAAEAEALAGEVAGLEARVGQAVLLEDRIGELDRTMATRERDLSQVQGEANRAAGGIRDAQALLENAGPIRAAAEASTRMEAEIQGHEEAGRRHMGLSQQLEAARLEVACFDRQRAVTIAQLEASIKVGHAQAAVLDRVPCAEETRATCLLLENARTAAALVSGFERDLDTALNTPNPYGPRLDDLERQRDEAAYDRVAHEAAREALAEARRLAVLLPRLEAAETRVAELTAASDRARQRAGELTEEIRGLRDRRAVLAAELEALTALGQELTQKRARLTTARQREATAREAVGQHRQALQDIEQAETQAGDLRTRAQELAGRGAVYALLDQACSKRGGVPALIIENAVPELERLANDLLARTSAGRLQVRLDTQAEGKTTGTMQEVLRITVLDGGLDRPYQTFSGAERFLVDLALRVALSKFLSHRAGAEIKLFVLDEGLGACDQGNRQAVMDALRAVGEDLGGMVLCITHIPELQDAFPQRLEVTGGPDGSRVKVVA